MSNTPRNLIPYLKSSGKYQLFNRSKNEFVSNEEYDEINLEYAEETYTVVKDNKYGILDADGIQIVDCQYEFAGGLDKNELARVKINQRFGFIDKSGKLIIPAIYNDIFNVFDGFASVEINGKYRLMNTVTNYIGQMEFDSVFILWKGMAHVELNGRFGYIDKDEQSIIPPIYDSIVRDSKNNIFKVEINNSNYLINSFNRKISYNYDSIDMSNDNAYEVRRKHRHGHIKNNGEVLIPLIYDKVTNFDKDFAGVCTDGKWLIVNYSNEVILDLDKFGVQYVHSDIQDGILVVSREYFNRGLFDLIKGEMITDFKYDFFSTAKEGLFRVNKEHSLEACMNKNGDLITDFKFSSIEDFYRGVACVEMRNENFRNGKIMFYIDDKGFEFRDQ